MKQKILICVAMLCVASFALSQQGGGGQRGQGGGQGQRGQGGGQRGQGGGGGNDVASLIARKDVQAELKLSDGQKSKIDELTPQRQRGQGGQGQGGQRGQGGQQGGGQGDREANRARQEELAKKIAEILDDNQEKRLLELRIQRAGNRAVFMEEVASKLGVTEDQKSKLDDLRSKQRDAQQSLAEKVRNQEVSREDAQATRTKNEKILDDEIAKVLTSEQKDQLKKLGGAPFKFEN